MNKLMMDYHTHRVVPQGGYLNAVTRADWECIAQAPPHMIPCFGVHPWHAEGIDVPSYAFELDEWLSRYPKADVGESGLDASPKWHSSLEAQRVLLHIHLGAAFRQDRMIHLHGVQAWAELLDLLRERQRCGTLPRVLLHAWNGSHEMAREFLQLGVLFSVGVRELSSPKAEARYARIPHDRLFAESDDQPDSWPRALALLSLLRGISCQPNLHE